MFCKLEAQFAKEESNAPAIANLDDLLLRALLCPLSNEPEHCLDLIETHAVPNFLGRDSQQASLNC